VLVAVRSQIGESCEDDARGPNVGGQRKESKRTASIGRRSFLSLCVVGEARAARIEKPGCIRRQKAVGRPGLIGWSRC
jgi:hypothetical protein